ncbi:hypothetical protein ACWE42_15425, partial [Sutcliffiella cohnii]
MIIFTFTRNDFSSTECPRLRKPNQVAARRVQLAVISWQQLVVALPLSYGGIMNHLVQNIMIRTSFILLSLL